MKHVLPISFFLFFVSSLFAQKENFDQFPRDILNQYRSQIDLHKALRQKETSQSRNNMPQQFGQTSKSSHAFSGSGVDTAWVKHFVSGNANSIQEASAMAVDSIGNIFVTGYSEGKICTIKYTSGGNIQWIKMFGEGNNGNWPNGIATDKEGNIYVNGTSSYSGGSSILYKIITVKYSTNGDTLWTRQYTPAGTAYIHSPSIAIVYNTNIYISWYNYDLYKSGIIKYDLDGNIVWEREVDGIVESKLAVDANGNAYISGNFSSNSFPYSTSTSIYKYNSIGEFLWTREFGIESLTDNIAVDTRGNLFMIVQKYANNLRSWDIKKINPNGELIWEHPINSSFSYDYNLTIDTSGNIYVSDIMSSGNTNYVQTIKYDTNGNTVWETNYGNFEIYSSYIKNIIVDDSGQVYVIGMISNFDVLTIKYASSGEIAWTREYNGMKNREDWPASIQADREGNVYVFGTTDAVLTSIDYYGGGDYLTIKYDKRGNVAWSKTYNEPKNYSSLSSILLDSSNNIYVTGRDNFESHGRYGSDGGEFATIKLNPEGNEQWKSLYKYTQNGLDGSSDFAFDNNGNLYVTGISSDSTTMEGSPVLSSCVTIKYNSNGDSLWSRRFAIQPTDVMNQQDIIVDNEGNIYVSTLDNLNILLLKFTKDGDTLWTQKYHYNGQTIYNYGAPVLALDKSGNIFLTCKMGLFKYSFNGTLLWYINYNGNALAVNDSGDVFVTSDGGTDCYRSDGTRRWSKNIPGRDIALDNQGFLYVSGSANNSFTISKNDQNGNTIWTRQYLPSASLYGTAEHIALDTLGKIYATGRSSNGDITICYDSAGSEKWVAHLSGFYGRQIFADKEGNVYVGGTQSFNNESYMTVVKYKQIPTLVTDHKSLVPNIFSLEQNYPNPFNPSTTIRYAIPDVGTVGRLSNMGTDSRPFLHVSLKIYDMLGRDVATLVNEEQTAGWKEVQWNATNFASGMYLVRMQANNFVVTKKILMMK